MCYLFYNVSPVCNGVQSYFPWLLNLIMSDEQKNINIVIKHLIYKHVFILVNIHQKH